MAGRGRNVRPQNPDPKKIPDFGPRDLEDIKEAFDMFDKRGTGVIDLGEMLELFDITKVHEQNPTVFRWLETVYEMFPEGATFKDLMETFQSNLGDTTSEEGLNKLFDLIDLEGQDFIDKGRLEELAREIGETVSEDELNRLIENYYGSVNEKVDRAAFIKMMLNTGP